jgi:amino acid transporter
MLGTFATAAVSTVLTSSLGLLVPSLAGRAGAIGILIVTLTFWTLVNLRGVTLGVRLNAIATAAKLLPLLLVALGGAWFVNVDNLRIAAMPSAGDVVRTSLLLVFAFAGVEVALVPSGEVRDTSHTVPRATALAMLAITSLYVVLQLVTQGILGGALAQSTVSPLADAAGASLGGWARSFLLVGATVSMFGYLGGVTLSMPRILFALARDGFLPRLLTRVHPVYRAPQPAILVQSLVTLGLAVSGTFERLALVANVSALALYLGCALAAWRLRSPAERRSPVAVLPWLTCLVILWLLTGMTRNEWLAFAAALALASLFYLSRKKFLTPVDPA